MNQFSFQQAAALITRCCCLFLLSASVSSAIANDRKESDCRSLGARAQEIAQARDAGKTMQEVRLVLDSQADKSSPTDQQVLLQAVESLFHQFRQMTPDAAAFEFFMDCLDND